MPYFVTFRASSRPGVGLWSGAACLQSALSWSRISYPFANLSVRHLAKWPNFQVICEVSDGLEAIQKTEQLKPDLILLDIGLPTLNGIEVARRIRKLSPESRILFVSQESAADVVQIALSTGAAGYVVKTRVASDLLSAVKAVTERSIAPL